MVSDELSRDVTVKVKKAPPNMVLNITVIETPKYKIRKWIGLKLIFLGASIVGFKEIKIEDKLDGSGISG